MKEKVGAGAATHCCKYKISNVLIASGRDADPDPNQN
jgi:hypothetical protein